MKTTLLKIFSSLLVLSLFASLLQVTTAHATASGPLDPGFNALGQGADNVVARILRQADGRILLGGSFSAYDDGSAVSANAPDGILRLNIDGSLDESFNYGTGSRGVNLAAGEYVEAIALQQVGGVTKILVGGHFSSYNGSVAPNNILRLNADGSLDTSFAGLGTNLGSSVAVHAIAVEPGGKIILGGYFSSYSDGVVPTPANAPNNVLRLNADGTLDQSFNYGTGSRGTNSDVWALAVQPDSQILVGGFFWTYNGNTNAPAGILRVNGSDGSLDTSFNTGSLSRGLAVIGSGRGYANAILIQGSKILVGGHFDAYGSGASFDQNASDGILRLNMADGSLDTSFNYGFNLGASGGPGGTEIYDLGLQSNGQIIIAGNFTTFNSDITVSHYLTRLTADGAVGTGFNSGKAGFDNTVNALAVQPNDAILAGGYFTAYNGLANAPDYILRLNDSHPDVTINQAVTQADPTSGSPINFTVQFSAAVTGFGDLPADVSLSGTAGGPLTALVTEIGPHNGSTYNVAVSGMSSAGTVIANIPADAALSADGFGNLASTSTDNSVTYALPANFTVSGTLGPKGAGAVVTYTGGFTIAAAGTGNYSFIAPNGWTGTITPSKKSCSTYTFSAPIVITTPLAADLPNQDFTTFSHVSADFNGDGLSDLTIFRRSTGVWHVRFPDGTGLRLEWGSVVDGDIPIIGDYDGDGLTDWAVYKPTTGTWYIQYAAGGAPTVQQWGNVPNGDIPLSGDYNGDGKADFAVYRPTTGTWYIRFQDGSTYSQQWGNVANGDIPVPGDYNCDGRTELAVYRPTTGTWYVRYYDGTSTSQQWGNVPNGDIPMSAGDYDGDGKADYAVWRPTNGTWYILHGDGSIFSLQWGNVPSGDIPVSGDYNGDGKTDYAVWRPGNGTWYIKYADGSSYSQQWGNNLAGDIPLPRHQ